MKNISSEALSRTMKHSLNHSPIKELFMAEDAPDEDALRNMLPLQHFPKTYGEQSSSVRPIGAAPPFERHA